MKTLLQNRKELPYEIQQCIRMMTIGGSGAGDIPITATHMASKTFGSRRMVVFEVHLPDCSGCSVEERGPAAANTKRKLPSSHEAYPVAKRKHMRNCS